MESKNIINFVCGSLGFSAIITAVAFIKMNYIVGSQMAHFSAATALAPLAGVQGVSFGAVTFLLSMFFKFLMGINPFTYLLYHIPSLCGALFWSGSRMFFGLVVPLVCMFLFIAHPQGAGAWMYTAYWIIPVVLTATRSRHLFAIALSCSFVMHAVGSVIWLYTAQILLQYGSALFQSSLLSAYCLQEQ